jgi:Exostosin family
LDPEEADFFYVPVYTSCFAHPIFGWADHPWYYFPTPYRVQPMAMMALEAKRWIENHYPWWRRRGGADHIWLFSHDEASCWVPTEIWNTSIILSHWGRKVLRHPDCPSKSCCGSSRPI